MGLTAKEMHVHKLSAPDMPAANWLEAMRDRRSRRSYTGDVVSAQDLDILNAHCESFAPSEYARTVLVQSAPPNIFVGPVGSYGRIKGAHSALVFLGQADKPDGKVAAGYTGEAAVLTATGLGLDTCWVGGFYRAGRVAGLIKMRAGEQIFGVSPVGHAEGSLSSAEKRIYRMSSTKPKARRTLDEIAEGWRTWPAWAHSAVEAARIAPSSMNRQPWRFRFEEGRLVISFGGVDTPKTSKRLDCGIAMLHAEVGARSQGISGHWEIIDHPTDVARFITD